MQSQFEKSSKCYSNLKQQQQFELSTFWLSLLCKSPDNQNFKTVYLHLKNGLAKKHVLLTSIELKAYLLYILEHCFTEVKNKSMINSLKHTYSVTSLKLSSKLSKWVF